MSKEKLGLLRLSKQKDKIFALDRFRTLNVDWFEVTAFYTQADKIQNNSTINFFFHKESKSYYDDNLPELHLEYCPELKHWNYRQGFRLWELGDTEKILIAYIHAESNNPAKFNPNSFKIKLSNWTLYNDWRKYFRLIQFIFKIDSFNITRIDLAFDGTTMLRTAIHEHYHTTFDFKYSYKGHNKLNRRDFRWFNMNFETKVHDGFTIGSRKSGLYVNCYEKLQELEKDDKYYIPERWIEQGMEIERYKEFNRFEISLKYPYTLDYFRLKEKQGVYEDTGELIGYFEPITREDLSDDYLYEVFNTIYTNLGLKIDGKPLIIGKPAKPSKRLRQKTFVKKFEMRFYISFLLTRWLNEGDDRQYDELLSAMEYTMFKDMYNYSILKKMLFSRYDKVKRTQKPKVEGLILELYKLRVEVLKDYLKRPNDIEISEESVKKLIEELELQIRKNRIDKELNKN